MERERERERERKMRERKGGKQSNIEKHKKPDLKQSKQNNNNKKEEEYNCVPESTQQVQKAKERKRKKRKTENKIRNQTNRFECYNMIESKAICLLIALLIN